MLCRYQYVFNSARPGGIKEKTNKIVQFYNRIEKILQTIERLDVMVRFKFAQTNGSWNQGGTKTGMLSFR